MAHCILPEERPVLPTLRSLAAAVAIPLAVAAPRLCAAEWAKSQWGETAIFPMASAPYPHPSRAEGFKYQDKTFPADPHYVDSSVGLFVPTGYKPGESIHLLFYFHGWNNSVAAAMDKYSLRQAVANSGRNVILVFPEGPKNASDSSCGRLEEPDAFKALADEVLAKLKEEGKVPHTTLGDVAIGGHSGAYKVIGFALKHGGLEDHIREVYLLDASYGQLEEFAGWIGRHPEGRFRSVFTEHLRDENQQIMAMLVTKGNSFWFGGDDATTLDVLRAQPVVFTSTTKLDHEGATTMLEPWLTASGLEVRQ